MTDAATGDTKRIGLPPPEAPDERKELRKFGLLFALIAGGLGGLSFYHHKVIAYSLLWSLASYALVFAVVWPRGVRPIFLGMMKFGEVMGFVVNHLFLTIAYYLIFTPFGLVMKLLRNDPLHRRFPEEGSYWRARDAAESDPVRCERPF